MVRALVSGLAACAAGLVVVSVHTGSVQAQAAAGTIAGQVKLTGPAPGNPIIRMGMDPMCAKLNGGKRPVNEIVLKGAGDGLANAFVDLDGKFTAPAPSGVVELDQRNCLYSPRVVGARVGQTLRVVNNDSLVHNVHAHSAKGNDFNFSQPTAGLKRDITLKGPDVMLRVGCDVHRWMTAYVGVDAHPYFSVSGADGSFKITGVPPGRYPIRVWHEAFGQLTQTVTVAAGKTATVTFSYSGKEKPSQARLQELTIPGASADLRLLATE